MQLYYTSKQLSQKWGVPRKKLLTLLNQGKIKGAFLHNKRWLIPIESQPPSQVTQYLFNPSLTPKPFVKWAGGKNQLMGVITSLFPPQFGCSIDNYVEPFVGGGAVLFEVLTKYKVKNVYINDINKYLISTYITIRDNVELLIDRLIFLESNYISSSQTKRSEIFFGIRDEFNSIKNANNEDHDKIKIASYFIFLNRTCFNGLYRENRSGIFNVPHGGYNNPRICDPSNLRLISKYIKDINITSCNYSSCLEYVNSKTFVYLDPPYRPLTDTSRFTAYTPYEFDDNSQIELKLFVDKLRKTNCKIMISNSDPKNTDKNDNFFDHLYKKYFVTRVMATRMINCKPELRGKITELVITNYKPYRLDKKQNDKLLSNTTNNIAE